MSDVADYEADILLWSERQAALLRELKGHVRGLPNELDLENVAEEIESVGRSELSAAESYVRQILLHLLKAASSERQEPIAHWLSEIRTFRSNLARAISPSMRQRIDLERIWRRAVRDVAEGLEDLGETVGVFPETCPFELESLASEDFDPRAALEQLKGPIG